MKGRGLTAMVVISAAGALGGCVVGSGPGGSDVTITVTRDFGSRLITSHRYRAIPEREGVTGLLTRSARVQLTSDGRSVLSIDGAGARPPSASWFLYVNGVSISARPSATAVHPGDRIWFDLHEGGVRPEAVVGSYPEPFVHGIAGKRLPVALECAPDVGNACRQVTSALEAVGVPVAVQQPGTGSGTDSIAVVVGTWSDLRGEIVGGLIAHGVASSGVYARFTGPGTRLQLLDRDGSPVRTLGGSAGLVGAVSQESSPPTWLITGTDPAGVNSAARAMTARRLGDRLAMAVAGDVDIPLPAATR